MSTTYVDFAAFLGSVSLTTDCLRVDVLNVSLRGRNVVVTKRVLNVFHVIPSTLRFIRCEFANVFRVCTLDARTFTGSLERAVTLRVIGGSNKDYAAYLISQLKVLRCPALEDRLGYSN